jgi:hypothetical protein
MQPPLKQGITMRKMIIAALASALFSPAASEEVPVRIFDVHIEDEMGLSALQRPAYVVGYTIENTSDQVIEILDLVVLGRNADGRIVERTDNPAIFPRSIPGGLAAGDSIVQRHALVAQNPSETVVEVEIRIHQVKLAD